MPISRTNERVFNRAVLVQAPQAAYQTPALDFTSAGGSGKVLWSRSIKASEGQQQESFQGSHGSIMERADGVQNTFRRPAITVEFYPTPTALATIFRSFGGPFAGTQVTWPNGIDAFYSYLYAQAEDGATDAKAYRFEDGWVRELDISVGGFGVAVARAEIIAEKVTEFDTDAAGLIYPSAIDNDEQFPHRAMELIHDISGTPVELAVKEFRLNMKHGFTHEPFNDEWARITKQGLFEVTGTLISRIMDETETLREEGLAQTAKEFRFRLIGAAGSEWRFDIRNVKWNPLADQGFAARNVLDFNQGFRAGTSDPAVEDTVEINIL